MSFGICVPWFLLKAKPSFTLASLAKTMAPAWAFLPCIALLYRLHSPWMLLALSVATGAVAFSLRRLIPAGVESDHGRFSNYQTTELRTLYGLPIADFRPMRAFAIALCLQGTLISAVTRHLLLAGILLSISLFLLAWQWSAFDTSTTRRLTGKRSPILLSALALVVTMLLLIPSVSLGVRGDLSQNRLHRNPSPATRRPAESAPPSSDYIGIILWPPHVKKEIVPPMPPNSSSETGGAKPLIIPFDGPYWYFKAPSRGPGPRAHVAHGKPTDVTIRSSDWAPLLMEAHQNLGSSINLACCSAIDVAIINADTRPGKIALGVVLTDSASPVKPSQSLGERTIVSSEADQIPISRPPVKEVLRFPISRLAPMRRFNEITLVFLPAKERSRGGAKVSIQSFTLIPR